MRKSLIAIALAGSLATGVASAQGMTLHTVDRGAAALTPVQYERHYERHEWQRNVVTSPAIDERQARIADRIERGMQSGRLSREEGWRLRHELENIQMRERELVADGRLSDRDERELMHRLDRLADHVRAEAHDRDRF